MYKNITGKFYTSFHVKGVPDTTLLDYYTPISTSRIYNPNHINFTVRKFKTYLLNTGAGNKDSNNVTY